MGSPLCDHLARLCLQCDWKLHSGTVNNHDYSRIPLCNNCVSQTAVVQCLEQGLCLCQTCVSNPNVISRFLFLQNVSNYNNLGFNFPLDIDLDSSSSSSSSFVDRNRALSFGSLPLNNEDSSSSFDIFQIYGNYTKNYSDQQVPMLQPDCLDIPKNSSCVSFNGYETKEDIENVLLNTTFDVEQAILDQNLFIPEVDLNMFLQDPLMDEITKQNAKTTSTEIISSSSSGRSSVILKDSNIEALANASSQDYYKNQMIGSKAKEETNDLGIFPDALVQLDCGQSQLILTDEMLSWEDQIFVAPRYNPQAREEAKQRYFAKKKKRKFGKQIRYESRKSTADTKRRMKGRFTKAGAEYDYDPRANKVKKGTNKTMS